MEHSRSPSSCVPTQRGRFLPGSGESRAAWMAEPAAQDGRAGGEQGGSAGVLGVGSKAAAQSRTALGWLTAKLMF